PLEENSLGSSTDSRQPIGKNHRKREPGLQPLLFPLSLFIPLLCSGCAMSPSLPLFGAAFPDCLFCMVGGGTAPVITHVMLSKTKRTALLHPLALSYPGLAAIFSVLIWFAFFYHQ